MSYNVNSKGYYGDFGGAYIPEMLLHNIDELKENYIKIMSDDSFQQEFNQLLKNYVGRPSPLYFSKNLSEDSSINPILASWLSTLIMLPFSIYLTYRATNDQSVFNFGESIVSFYKKIEYYVRG